MEKTLAVERSIWINAARDRAWRAVTKPEHLDKWYADKMFATFYRWHIPALEVGRIVKFYNKDNESDMQIATIEDVDPLREFTLRWQPHANYPQVSLVTCFLLAEENGGTRVTISESGYENVPEAERQSVLDASGEGYTLSMENLKAYLEGRDLPY
jgi:uncharacterized protein YndB with AHSA1/START domain